MTFISHTATFKATGSPEQMLMDLNCPQCGHHDPTDAPSRIIDGKLRIFCDCCAAFVTIALTPEQEDHLRRWYAR